MKVYKDVFVGQGSALDIAIQRSAEEARKVHVETTKRYESLFSKEDRDWFWEKQRLALAQAKL